MIFCCSRAGVGGTQTASPKSGLTGSTKRFNNYFHDPRTEPNGNALSTRVILGWSAFRISVIILLPTLLSFVIGIWFNLRGLNDLTTIQTAWGIASYVATAGGCKFRRTVGSKF